VVHVAELARALEGALAVARVAAGVVVDSIAGYLELFLGLDGIPRDQVVVHIHSVTTTLPPVGVVIQLLLLWREVSLGCGALSHTWR
jgi:hypothetical protein